MNIEIASESFDEQDFFKGENQTEKSLWNGKEIAFSPLGTHKDSLSKAIARIELCGSYVMGNSPIGVCPRGHLAYHIYQQPPYESILLCDFKGDRHEEHCPFELYKFMKLIGK